MTEAELAARLEDAKWHLQRYDGLHAVTASRAGAVLSANALVLAGVAVVVGLAPRSSPSDSSLPAGVGALAVIALLFAGLSVVGSARALIALRAWRRRFGRQLLPRPFFQHNETLELLPTHDEFVAAFKQLPIEDELDAALTALWVRTKTRNDSLRVSIISLFAAMAFMGVAVLIVAFV
jgi:hypothetical protein